MPPRGHALVAMLRLHLPESRALVLPCGPTPMVTQWFRLPKRPTPMPPQAPLHLHLPKRQAHVPPRGDTYIWA
jgi:hypothetical protein